MLGHGRRIARCGYRPVSDSLVSLVLRRLVGAIFAGVREQGLPGVMARRRDTPYDAEAGQDWVRVVAGVDPPPTAPTEIVADLPVPPRRAARPEEPPPGPALAPPLPAPTERSAPAPPSGTVARGRHSRDDEDAPGLW